MPARSVGHCVMASAAGCGKVVGVTVGVVGPVSGLQATSVYSKIRSIKLTSRDGDLSRPKAVSISINVVGLDRRCMDGIPSGGTKISLSFVITLCNNDSSMPFCQG